MLLAGIGETFSVANVTFNTLIKLNMVFQLFVSNVSQVLLPVNRGEASVYMHWGWGYKPGEEDGWLGEVQQETTLT